VQKENSKKVDQTPQIVHFWECLFLSSLLREMQILNIAAVQSKLASYISKTDAGAIKYAREPDGHGGSVLRYASFNVIFEAPIAKPQADCRGGWDEFWVKTECDYHASQCDHGG
jgi:hypothetical protein